MAAILDAFQPTGTQLLTSIDAYVLINGDKPPKSSIVRLNDILVETVIKRYCSNITVPKVEEDTSDTNSLKLEILYEPDTKTIETEQHKFAASV